MLQLVQMFFLHCPFPHLSVANPSQQSEAITEQTVLREDIEALEPPPVLDLRLVRLALLPLEVDFPFLTVDFTSVDRPLDEDLPTPPTGEGGELAIG